jgi:hypothetical protein
VPDSRPVEIADHALPSGRSVCRIAGASRCLRLGCARRLRTGGPLGSARCDVTGLRALQAAGSSASRSDQDIAAPAPPAGSCASTAGSSIAASSPSSSAFGTISGASASTPSPTAGAPRSAERVRPASPASPASSTWTTPLPKGARRDVGHWRDGNGGLARRGLALLGTHHGPRNFSGALDVNVVRDVDLASFGPEVESQAARCFDNHSSDVDHLPRA